MGLDRLPPAHIGPFELDGLEWITLPPGYTADGVSGVTHSLATAESAHAKLLDLGFTYTWPKLHGTMDRLFDFNYMWIERSEHGGTTYGRRVLVLLVTVDPTQIPRYEVVHQITHERQGPTFGFQEVPEKQRLFPSSDYWIRPTLED